MYLRIMYRGREYLECEMYFLVICNLPPDNSSIVIQLLVSVSFNEFTVYSPYRPYSRESSTVRPLVTTQPQQSTSKYSFIHRSTKYFLLNPVSIRPFLVEDPTPRTKHRKQLQVFMRVVPTEF